MTIRHFVVAALMVGASAAHADVITSGTAGTQSSFLSGWTTGNGTDVMGSGVLSSNMNLVGGIAYGSASSVEALLGKASGSLGAAADATKLSYAKGIEGMYVLGAGHGILAAMLGNGVSVVGSNGGVVVTQGSTAGATTGSGTTYTAMTTSGGGTSTPAAAPSSTPSSTPTAAAGGSTGAGADVSLGGSTDMTLPAGNVVALPVKLDLPGQATPAADVPEPSSIALMLAGMLGAGALTRRRTR